MMCCLKLVFFPLQIWDGQALSITLCRIITGNCAQPCLYCVVCPYSMYDTSAANELLHAYTTFLNMPFVYSRSFVSSRQPWDWAHCRPVPYFYYIDYIKLLCNYMPSYAFLTCPSSSPVPSWRPAARRCSAAPWKQSLDLGAKASVDRPICAFRRLSTAVSHWAKLLFHHGKV